VPLGQEPESQEEAEQRAIRCPPLPVDPPEEVELRGDGEEHEIYLGGGDPGHDEEEQGGGEHEGGVERLPVVPEQDARRPVEVQDREAGEHDPEEAGPKLFCPKSRNPAATIQYGRGGLWKCRIPVETGLEVVPRGDSSPGDLGVPGLGRLDDGNGAGRSQEYGEIQEQQQPVPTSRRQCPPPPSRSRFSG